MIPGNPNIITTVAGLVFAVSKLIPLFFPEAAVVSEVVEGAAVGVIGTKAVESGQVRKTAVLEKQSDVVPGQPTMP